MVNCLPAEMDICLLERSLRGVSKYIPYVCPCNEIAMSKFELYLN